MNTRSLDEPRADLPAPALLLAVLILVSSCASSRADCRSHAERPTLALEWSAGLIFIDRPSPKPACSGRSCSKTAIPPVVASPAPPTPRDLAEPTSPRLIAAPRSADLFDRPEGWNPIGRATEVDRPPC